MKRLLTLVAFFATLHASAQQVNPVPDYVFRNQMSVGRNAVTDTAAYFSIGPRYGATKGFMPPIVGDTATFSSGKRNGLLIFSVQKNKFLYWDSVRVQWSDMAGSSGAYIVAGDTSAMLAPYLRKADTTAMLSPYYRSAAASAALALKLNISDTSTMLGNYIRHAGYGLTKSGQSFLVDTLNIATRAWRQKGLDSLAALEVSGSGTTNYVAKFTAGSTIGNSQIFDNGTNVGINTASPASRLHVFGTSGATTIIAEGATNNANYGRLEMRGRPQSANHSTGYIVAASTEGGQAATNIGAIDFAMSGAGGNAHYMSFATHNGTSLGERLRITSGGNVGIGTNNPLQKLVVSNGGVEGIEIVPGALTGQSQIRALNRSTSGYDELVMRAGIYNFQIGTTNAAYIHANGRVGINTTTDAGYQLDVNGTLRSVNGANFATTSGNVGIGNASPSFKLSVNSSDYQIGNLASTYITGGINYNAFVVGQIALNQSAQIGYARDTSNAANSFFYVTPYGSAEGGQFRMSAAGNVGIGFTSNPSYKLDINGTLRSVNGANFATTSGNVGVGTASPNTILHVSKSETLNAFTDYLQLSDNTNGLRLSNYFSAAGIRWDIRRGTTTMAAFTPDNELLINTTTDAGDYKLQVSGNIYNTGSAVLAATSGNVGIGTASPVTKLHISGAGSTSARIQATGASGSALIDFIPATQTNPWYLYVNESRNMIFQDNASERGRINSAGEWIIDASGTDAGDYKLQVVGNARIGTGKLDISSNTTFGLGVARSGTSEVAGQIYNSNGILYLGAESSAGGQIFSGSSAYAAVIGSGANYPLQFATNNTTRATITSSGKFIVGATSEYFFSSKMEVNGGMAIRNTPTDGTLLLDSTALNLYGITNRVGFNMNNGKLTGSNASPAFTIYDWTWNTTANVNLVDISLVNTASGASSNYFRISDGTNEFRVTKAAEVVTAAPTGGSIRKWKLGEAATVSPTSPNRTIRVEIDGVVYYLHAKTTND